MPRPLIGVGAGYSVASVNIRDRPFTDQTGAIVGRKINSFPCISGTGI